MTSSASEVLLSVKDLRVYFPVARSLFARQRRHVRAVDGVTFSIRRRETMGLVGESGCGKTTIGRALVRLLEPTAGTITFEGRDIGSLRGPQLRHFRRNVQMVFQDPYTSLNPRLTVQQIVAEPLRINKWGSRNEIQKRTQELLEAVGLPYKDARRFPHEFSGGQRQRIAIARALALAPQLVVCDEPVSALDMSIQAKILKLYRCFGCV